MTTCIQYNETETWIYYSVVYEGYWFAIGLRDGQMQPKKGMLYREGYLSFTSQKIGYKRRKHERSIDIKAVAYGTDHRKAYMLGRVRLCQCLTTECPLKCCTAVYIRRVVLRYILEERSFFFVCSICII